MTRTDAERVAEIVRGARVARLATLSRNGRPSVSPLYFIVQGGRIWLGTPEWTLAARNVAARSAVTILLDVDGAPDAGHVVRVEGKARLSTDRRAARHYALRAARRYVLPPRAILHRLAHLRQQRVLRGYHASGRRRGRSAVIVVDVTSTELLRVRRPAGLGAPAGPA